MDLGEEVLGSATLLVGERHKGVPRRRKDRPAKQSVDRVRRMERERLPGAWVEPRCILDKVSFARVEKVALNVASQIGDMICVDPSRRVEWLSTSLLNRRDVRRMQLVHDYLPQNL